MSRRKYRTAEEFKKEVEELNPTIEVVGDFVNTSVPIALRCRICGHDWETSPVVVLYHTRKCPICAHKEHSYKSQEEIEQLLPDNYTLISDYEPKKKVTVRCNTCHNTFAEFVNTLIENSDCCPFCNPMLLKTITPVMFQMIQEANPNIEILDIDESRNCFTYQCKKCGKKGKAKTESDFIRMTIESCGCLKCGILDNLKQKIRTKKFINRLIFPVLPLSVLDGNKEIEWECSTCGHVFRATPHNVLHIKHCPICQKEENLRQRRKKRLQIANEKNITILNIDNYTDNQTAMRCLCNRCGHQWSTTASNLNKRGCPKCNRSDISFGERFLYHGAREIFGENNVSQKNTILIGEELDVVIQFQGSVIAIEFGSWYWHQNRLWKDFEKEQLCEENNITLLTIYEQCPDVITDEVPSCARVYHYSLAEEYGHETLISILSEIAEKANRILPNNLHELIITAMRNENRVTKQEIKTKQLHDFDPEVHMDEEYLRQDFPMQFHCDRCGNVWTSNYKRVTRRENSGHRPRKYACPKCNNLWGRHHRSK